MSVVADDTAQPIEVGIIGRDGFPLLGKKLRLLVVPGSAKNGNRRNYPGVPGNTIKLGNPMIHHVSLGTNDVEKARAFYDPVLAILGLRLIKADAESLDYGVATILFSLESPSDGKAACAGNGVHVAFVAKDPAMVDEFHRVALECGGSDEGAPGLRPKYNAHYYGAFVRDPDGNKIEAVTHSAP